MVLSVYDLAVIFLLCFLANLLALVLVVVIVVGWGKKYLDKQKDSWGPLAGILGGMGGLQY